MDNPILLTVLGMFIANAALIIPLFLWNRAESRADIRHMDTKLEANRSETNAQITAIHQEIKAIHEEMKDFHGRLCAIEERYRKK